MCAPLCTQVVTDDVLTHQSYKPASPVREDPIGNPELQVADPTTDHQDQGRPASPFRCRVWLYMWVWRYLDMWICR